MRILNPVGLQVAPISGRIGYPGHSITAVVKALYRLTPDSISELLDGELAFPTGDSAVDEDDDRSEIRYESDFAHYKPRADLTLVGKCRPPGGQPVSTALSLSGWATGSDHFSCSATARGSR